MTPTPTVLHVVEAFGGGVQSSLAHFIESSPFANHVVFGRVRSGESTEHPLAEVVIYQGGAIGFAREMRRLARRIEPDVVHFHSSKAGILRLLQPQSACRAYSPHCYAFERLDVPAFVRWAFRVTESMLARVTDVVVAVSPHEAMLARSLCAKSDVVTVSNLAQMSPFVPHGNESRRVVTVGRISAQKAPERYAAVAAESPDDIEFVWIGDGDPALRQKLETSGVRVTGWLDAASVRDELRLAALYLHTADWEASPMSIAQALGEGTPVICSELPTLRSLGYLTVEASKSEISRAVVAFFDDERYRSMVQASAARAVDRVRDDEATQVLGSIYRKRGRGE